MTIKTKHYIEVSDVIGLHFQCIHCKAEIDLGIKELEGAVLNDCPVCRRHWAALPTVVGTQVVLNQPFIKLVEALNELKQVLGPKSQMGFKMLLELNPSMPSISQKSE